jgi:hypothetical protein
MGFYERSIRDAVERKPFGTIGDRIGGHRFPPDERDGMSDADRIQALEDPVRGLREGLMKWRETTISHRRGGGVASSLRLSFAPNPPS